MFEKFRKMNLILAMNEISLKECTMEHKFYQVGSNNPNISYHLAILNSAEQGNNNLDISNNIRIFLGKISNG